MVFQVQVRHLLGGATNSSSLSKKEPKSKPSCNQDRKFRFKATPETPRRQQSSAFFVFPRLNLQEASWVGGSLNGVIRCRVTPVDFPFTFLSVVVHKLILK